MGTSTGDSDPDRSHWLAGAVGAFASLLMIGFNSELSDTRLRPPSELRAMDARRHPPRLGLRAETRCWTGSLGTKWTHDQVSKCFQARNP